MMTETRQKNTFSYHCKNCDYNTCDKSNYDKHILTRRHLKMLQTTRQKSTDMYVCVCCDYSSCSLKNYNAHLLTRRHEMMTLKHDTDPLRCPDLTNTKSHHICTQCSRQYSTRQSLYVHKKKCPNSKLPKLVSLSQQPTDMIIVEIIKQNHELQNIILDERKIREEERQHQKLQEERQIERENQLKDLLIEIAKKETTIINNSNTHNNQFNLNMFLNEQCKDAMNFMDFVNSLQVSFEELENMAHKGYVAGMSDIIMNGLRQLDVYHRPIHCTDVKREIMYIKDNNEWVIDEDQSRVKKVIAIVSKKNMRLVREWQTAHPKCEILDSKEQYLHMNIMQQCLNSETQCECNRNDAKIIKNIAKFTYLDKGRNIVVSLPQSTI